MSNKHENRGRKKLDPSVRKVLIPLYVEQGDIDVLGGKEECQKVCYEAIDKLIKLEHEREASEQR